MIGILILKLMVLAILVYAGAVIFMWVRQDRFLFKPNHWEPLPEFEKYRWDREVNGVKLQGWFLDKGCDKTVIYHGGNAEDLAGHCDVLFQGLTTNALLVNYRGYGQSEGRPAEKDMIADCIAVLDLFCKEKAVPFSSIFLMGRSLGSGVSVQVAAARPEVAGVILVTPYESIAAIARFQYPWLPIERLLHHPFQSIDFAPALKLPALVLLAEFDEVIPVESGLRLGSAWGGPKEIITLPTGHMDINEHPDYFTAINRFVK
ncbi:alpha/beta hydrolase [Tichowtungia aerotolerans]|uniref:Alpha/beta hydrolase n=1 Tax=Tichowtungia aerotolerans TaxID=2697043 RepID=A0A6P1MBI8_9BACT|nr:alpha/beta fold hydrolase [Tichowtungia aerotolerans]QHI70463.1 alpha/beta hydrolase [Tichowtungia aerotolerans]